MLQRCGVGGMYPPYAKVNEGTAVVNVGDLNGDALLAWLRGASGYLS
jgi:hypothetical protein